MRWSNVCASANVFNTGQSAFRLSEPSYPAHKSYRKPSTSTFFGPFFEHCSPLCVSFITQPKFLQDFQRLAILSKLERKASQQQRSGHYGKKMTFELQLFVKITGGVHVFLFQCLRKQINQTRSIRGNSTRSRGLTDKMFEK